MRSRTRSTSELVAKMGLPQKQALAVLRGLERDGLAEQGPDGWRLTAEAERRYGRALSAFDEWLEQMRRDAA